MLRAVEELGDELVEQVVWRQKVAQDFGQEARVNAGLAGRRARLHAVQKVGRYFEHFEQVGLQVRVPAQLEYLRVAEYLRLLGV